MCCNKYTITNLYGAKRDQTWPIDVCLYNTLQYNTRLFEPIYTNMCGTDNIKEFVSHFQIIVFMGS